MARMRRTLPPLSPTPEAAQVLAELRQADGLRALPWLRERLPVGFAWCPPAARTSPQLEKAACKWRCIGQSRSERGGSKRAGARKRRYGEDNEQQEEGERQAEATPSMLDTLGRGSATSGLKEQESPQPARPSSRRLDAAAEQDRAPSENPTATRPAGQAAPGLAELQGDQGVPAAAAAEEEELSHKDAMLVLKGGRLVLDSVLASQAGEQVWELASAKEQGRQSLASVPVPAAVTEEQPQDVPAGPAPVLEPRPSVEPRCETTEESFGTPPATIDRAWADDNTVLREDTFEVGCTDFQQKLDYRGTLKVSPGGFVTIFCKCAQCVEMTGPEGAEMAPPDFERHAGRASSKKWRSSIWIAEGDEERTPLLSSRRVGQAARQVWISAKPASAVHPAPILLLDSLPQAQAQMEGSLQPFVPDTYLLHTHMHYPSPFAMAPSPERAHPEDTGTLTRPSATRMSEASPPALQPPQAAYSRLTRAYDECL
eukprot:SM000301S11761  [mRNA]  locus=s301:56146:58370:+ [translate_table: standard]